MRQGSKGDNGELNRVTPRKNIRTKDLAPKLAVLLRPSSYLAIHENQVKRPFALPQLNGLLPIRGHCAIIATPL